MNPHQLAERAAEAYLAAYPLTTVDNVYKGIENAESTEDSDGNPSVKELPCVVLEAEGQFNEVVPYTNTFRGVLSVNVEADGDDVTDEIFNTMCREVFSRFMVSNLAALLSSNTSGFHCYQARIASVGNAIRHEENWENSLKIDIVIAPADLV